MGEHHEDEPASEERADVTKLLRGIVAREAGAAAGGALDPLDPRDPHAPRDGERVRYVGDYELVEELARGGMGVVFRARQLSLERDVALKMILDGGFASDESRARFRAEAEAAAALRHPNIVQVYEVGEHHGLPYFSMELVEGESLASVARRGPLRARHAAELVATIADAVQHAHENGTLHRDLKPANVLIAADGAPRVTDFGLAKRLDGESLRTHTGEVIGTPNYMAPEQALGNKRLVGPRSDVHALGAVLYELLTGRPPFQGESALETLRQVVEHVPAPPSAINPSVPSDLDAVVLKCLEKRAARRYVSARELAADLRRFLARQPVRARATGRGVRLVAWFRAHPWSVLAGAAAVSVALTIAAYALFASREYWRLRAEGIEAPHAGAFGDELVAAYLIGPIVAAAYWVTRGGRGSRDDASPGALYVCALVGVAGLAGTALSTAELIDRIVWGRFSHESLFVGVASLAAASLFLLVRVYHAFEARATGAVVELSEEQEDELMELLEEGGKAGFKARLALAKARYVEWTGADPYHATIAVHRLWRDLRIAYPNRVPSDRRGWVPALLFLAVFVWFYLVRD